MSKEYAIDQLKGIQPGEYGYEEAQFVIRFKKSLLDYDCWIHLEEMIGEKVPYAAYLYVDRAFEDPLIEYEEDSAPDFVRLWKRYKVLRENHVRICPICGKVYLEYPAISRIDDQTEICPDCGTAEALQDFADNVPRKRTVYQKLKDMEETERRNDERVKRFLAEQKEADKNTP